MTKTKVDSLKLLAFLTMVVDHIGLLFFPHLSFFRTIGRLSFPLFAYGIARGYQYTSNKKRYFYRMVLYAFVSQVPYSFLNPELNFRPFRLNILFTFVIGLLLLMLIDKVREDKRWVPVIVIAPIFIYFFEGTGLSISYGAYGLLLIITFYLFLESTFLITAFTLISVITLFIEAGLTFIEVNLDLDSKVSSVIILVKNIDTVFKTLIESRGFLLLEGSFFQMRSLLAFVPLLLRKNEWFVWMNKQWVYWFYPLHLFILIGMKYFMI